MTMMAPAFVSPLSLGLTRSHAQFSKRWNRSSGTSHAPAVNTRRHTTTRCSLSTTQQNVLAGLAVPALPIVAYSEFVLGTTGCGLPPGPNGLLGAAEGVSYLVVAALVAASVYVKATTGKGLPPGPANLLGAAEGIAYLLVVVGLADAAYVAKIYGSLPSSVPTEGSRCFEPYT